MALRYYANAAATTLSNSMSSGQTSMVVASVSGLPVSYPYTLIIDRGLSTEEVVSVTSASGTTLTVTRGYDSTTAFAHGVGATVAHGISAIDPREANAHVNATSAVHGLTGAVVGTTDGQTLTNKTISADSNNIQGFAASSFIISNASGVADGAAAQKVIPAGVVVGTTDTQTLTNKTLVAPKVDSIKDASGNTILDLLSNASAVNSLRAINTATTVSPILAAQGSDANLDLILTPKGTGVVKASGSEVVTLSGTQTLTNKTLTSPTISSPTITGVGYTAFAYKATDEGPMASNTTLQNDDHLLASIPAAGTYRIELSLQVLAAADTNGDIKLAWTFPTGTLYEQWIGTSDTIATGNEGDAKFIGGMNASSPSAVRQFGLTASHTTIRGTFIFVATASGTLQLQWAQFTSHANGTTVKAGSNIYVERVA